MEEISVYEQISKKYYELSAAEKKIGDYVLSHQGKTQLMSISELAEASDVSEATVTRFCRKLGCGSYNEFRLEVAKHAAARGRVTNPLSGEVYETDSFSEVCSKLYNANVSAMTQTLELVKPEQYIKAADLIEAAKKVVCMGQGGSMIIAEECAHLFSTTGSKFSAIADSHYQIVTAATMDEGDVILFFSYSGATKDMMDTLRVAGKRGGKVILVTHFPNSPGAKYADVILQCGADESPLQLGSIGARIAQLYLMDILFSEVCRRNLDKCRERRSMIADALTEKHL